MKSPITRYFQQLELLRRVGLVHGNFLYMIDYSLNGEMQQSTGMLKILDDKLVQAAAGDAIFVILRRLPISIVAYDETGARIDTAWSSIEMLRSSRGQWSCLDRRAIQEGFDRDRRLKLITPLPSCRRFVDAGYDRWIECQPSLQVSSTAA
ncbi:hypothetical protein [Nevskia ramosa]|uniref:hypothetical protein n=1 Tax=Nevskia ramosa TaxID=64002 RepID=UPI002352BF38|nr:hypothetical protein [Nevskia ramosa]